MCSASARSLKNSFPPTPALSLSFLILHNTRAFWITYSFLFLFGSSVGTLQYWANRTCTPLHFSFLSFFFFLQSTGFNIWTFCVDRRNVTVPGTNHWRCLLAFDKAYQLCYIVADAFLVGTVVQNSLWKPTVSLHSPFAALFSHEWMSSVCNSPGAAIGFWLQTVHYSFFFFFKAGCICICMYVHADIVSLIFSDV